MVKASNITISKSCSLIGVKRCCYYNWSKRISPKDKDDEVRKIIHGISLEFLRYGYRRTTAELQN